MESEVNVNLLRVYVVQMNELVNTLSDRLYDAEEAVKYLQLEIGKVKEFIRRIDALVPVE